MSTRSVHDLDGRVAVVTGGGSGIGAAAVRLLAGRGARVVVADVDLEAARATVASVRRSGGEATASRTDVAERDDCFALVDLAVERYGRLDLAFNNAGISEPPTALTDLEPAVWERVLSVNLAGVLWCLQAELARLLAQGEGGAIVNTASGAAIVPAPLQPSYTTSKHGVLGLTKLAAQEHARSRIRVNAVLPGTTDTPMLRAFMAGDPGIEATIRRVSPTGELGRPEEIAEAAVWLLSDAASYVSGQGLLVDGGAVVR